MAQPFGNQLLNIEPTDSSENEENLEAFIGTRWDVYKVTPLHKFKYSEARLKQYAMRLREKLLYDEENNGARFKAKFIPLPELKFNDDVPVPVQITVESLVGEDNYQLIYKGILLSRENEPHASQLEDYISLPLLLCRGRERVKDNVHKILCEFFDCYIKKVYFEGHDLLWLLGLSIHFHTDKPDNVCLSFTVPGCGYRNSVDYAIQMTILKREWKRIHNDDNGGISYDEIIKLKKECFNNIQEVYGIHIDMLQLNKIRHRGFLATNKGSVRLSREITAILLQFLQKRVNSNEIQWEKYGLS